MILKFVCPYWGCKGLHADTFLQMVKEAGYDGAEVNIPEDKGFGLQLMRAANSQDLFIIGQQWLPPMQESFGDYLARYQANLLRLIALKPAFINSHTGKDFFSFDENCRLIDLGFILAEQWGVPVLHETHRGRFTFHPASLIPYLKKYAQLKLTSDLSHWCTVCESLLEDQEDTLQQVIPHIQYIHARIGHEHAPQVNDPRALEWGIQLQRFLTWWDNIIAYHQHIGTAELSICCEFGPVPYMPAEPYTGWPYADQWELNLWMKDLLQERHKHLIVSNI